MPQAGDNTIGAVKPIGGRYYAQLRMYSENERYGLMCDTFDLKFLGFYSERKSALAAGRAWLRLPGADAAAETAWDILYNHNVMGITDARGCINDTLRAVRAAEAA